MLATNGHQRAGRTVAWIGLWLAAGWLCGCASPPPSPYRWTEFVSVRGHANPIPKPWVATPEGRFAHELVIPNPVPADSGYQPGMSADDYFRLLCKRESGDFIFRKVENVEGIYFARPPTYIPSHKDLIDRWKLEHPYLEGQLGSSSTGNVSDRAKRYVDPPRKNYRFYEEPNSTPEATAPYWRLSGYRRGIEYKDGKEWKRLPDMPWTQVPSNQLISRYGITWRGIRRPFDRENGIAGGEIIAYDLQTNEVLAVFRNYAYTGPENNPIAGLWMVRGCEILNNQMVFDSGLGKSRQVLNPIE